VKCERKRFTKPPGADARHARANGSREERRAGAVC